MTVFVLIEEHPCDSLYCQREGIGGVFSSREKAERELYSRQEKHARAKALAKRTTEVYVTKLKARGLEIYGVLTKEKRDLELEAAKEVGLTEEEQRLALLGPRPIRVDEHEVR